MEIARRRGRKGFLYKDAMSSRLPARRLAVRWAEDPGRGGVVCACVLHPERRHGWPPSPPLAGRQVGRRLENVDLCFHLGRLFVDEAWARARQNDAFTHVPVPREAPADAPCVAPAAPPYRLFHELSDAMVVKKSSRRSRRCYRGRREEDGGSAVGSFITETMLTMDG